MPNNTQAGTESAGDLDFADQCDKLDVELRNLRGLLVVCGLAATDHAAHAVADALNAGIGMIERAGEAADAMHTLRA